MSKTAAKSASAKKDATKSSKAASKTRSKTTAIQERAAEVESNLGGSQSLRDFLSKVGWS
jgi:hypothetical protein